MGKNKGNPEAREKLEKERGESKPRFDKKMFFMRIVVSLMIIGLLGSGFVAAFGVGV